nr:MAG TPA: hypothetical protein [Crassvirales sp.]
MKIILLKFVINIMMVIFTLINLQLIKLNNLNNMIK